jgi:hypothetical protein
LFAIPFNCPLDGIEMNGLLTHSNQSFQSFESSLHERPQSIFSFATSADTVKAQGIGTLSGKMVYAVGKSALRRIETLAIRRKLAKVLAVFPHKDDSAINDIETIYDHTLELSRYFHQFNISSS